MTEAPQSDWRAPYNKVAGYFFTVGAASMAIAALDAYVFDFIGGDNPLNKSEGGSFKSFLKDLRDAAPEGTAMSDMTLQQLVTSLGTLASGFSIMSGSYRGFRVSTTATLAALGGLEATEAIGGLEMSRFLVYGGGSSIMAGGAIIQATEKSLSEKIADGASKAGGVVKRIRGKKD